MKRWMPPASATRSAPGRMARWYVFASTTWLPSSRSWLVVMPFTVAEVPTGMNIGVWKSPWAVV